MAIKKDEKDVEQEGPNKAHLRLIYANYAKERPVQAEMYKDEFARNLELSEEEIGKIISR